MRIEAEAFLKRYKVGQELGINVQVADGLYNAHEQWVQGIIDDDQFLERITDYNVAYGTIKRGDKVDLARDVYGEQYDEKFK